MVSIQDGSIRPDFERAFPSWRQRLLQYLGRESRKLISFSWLSELSECSGFNGWSGAEGIWTPTAAQASTFRSWNLRVAVRPEKLAWTRIAESGNEDSSASIVISATPSDPVATCA